MSNDTDMHEAPLKTDNEETHQQTKTKFSLSRIIQAHNSDVKAVLATSQDALISGSCDETVKHWIERKGYFHLNTEFPQHERLTVNSVAFYQANSGDWFLFAGRQDGTIAIYNSANSEPCTILSEHKTNVCILYVDSIHKILMSGSWDHQALVWPIESITDVGIKPIVLSGHKNSVWAVTSFLNREHLYLTGSADRTIKLWEKDRAINTFEGHEDVVRALVILSDTTFVSASNDSTLRIWSIETGTCLQIYQSITMEYIYSLCKVRVKSNEEFLVNSTEKGYLEVWKLDANSLEPSQLIRTPATSLWSLTSIKNGDIAVAGSNGCIYIFTTLKERIADSTVLEAFDADVAELVNIEQKEQEMGDNLNIRNMESIIESIGKAPKPVPLQPDPIYPATLTVFLANSDAHGMGYVSNIGEVQEKAVLNVFSYPYKQSYQNPVCFCYLLLDPRDIMVEACSFREFVKAVFYVGKGTDQRPFDHLKYVCSRDANVPILMNDANPNETAKNQNIRAIWYAKRGVVILQVFMWTYPWEALIREAAMIEAIGIKQQNRLTNIQRGNYYETAAKWNPQQKEEYGTFLLYKAYQLAKNTIHREVHELDVL